MKQMGTISAEIELINAVDLALESRNILDKDEVKHIKVRMIVDSGAWMMCINETIQEILQLPFVERRKTFLANGIAEEFDVVGPIMVKFENRTATCNAFVLPGDSESLLGAIPMEEMDVIDESRGAVVKQKPPTNLLGVDNLDRRDYAISTSAPESFNLLAISSASALETPSFIFFGAPSTNSFASFKPKPVKSFTTLTTLSLLAPAAFNTTLNAVFSSAAGAPAPPPAAGPATATAAAAGSIPYSSFKIFASSFTSFTDKFTNCSANCFKSAIFLLFNNRLHRSQSSGGRLCCAPTYTRELRI
jgi:hypothetical protein